MQAFRLLLAAAAVIVISACETVTPMKAPANPLIGVVIPGQVFCDLDWIKQVAEGDKVGNAEADALITKGLQQKRCIDLRRRIPVQVVSVETVYVDYAGDQVAVIGVVPAGMAHMEPKFMLLAASKPKAEGVNT